jgi:tetraacyldisaccharide-1-P 4'-kinase
VTFGYAKSGKGKTATVIHVASAAMARGAQVSVIDRSTNRRRELLLGTSPVAERRFVKQGAVPAGATVAEAPT